MKEKRVRLTVASLFGAMFLFFTVLLAAGALRRPDLIKLIQGHSPLVFYFILVLLATGLMTAAGLFFGWSWARWVAVFYTSGIMFSSYFTVSNLLTQAGLGSETLISIYLLRATTFSVGVTLIWALCVLYLLLAPVSPPVSPAIPGEPLNTR